jgi:dolichyl-phosphate-mannose--protein O-mannosyl transferase
MAGQRQDGKKVTNFIYFWPLYTGTAIPIDDWRARMWLDTWV